MDEKVVATAEHKPAARQLGPLQVDVAVVLREGTGYLVVAADRSAASVS